MENNCINDNLLKQILDQNTLMIYNRTESMGTAVYFYHKIIRQYRDSSKAKFRNHLEKLKKNKLEVNRLENQIKLFESNDFIKESVRDPCPICLDEYSSEIAISICRHIICGDCVKLLFNNSREVSCPFCRNKLKKDDYSFTTMEQVDRPDTPEEEAGEAEEQSADQSANQSTEENKVDTYGTKLAYLIDYLLQLFESSDDRVIIFSQYDKMLKLIGKVLNNFQIKHIYIKGNVFVVNKNIHKFKTDDSIRVVMLSSETCASGNNLTEASHIIFADVLNANKERTRDIEGQAIGRAVRLGQNKPVLIKRLIMKNTIEEEYFKKNRYDMQDLQMGEATTTPTSTATSSTEA
jgi:SNF2 family DNA or RNA helicase